MDELLATLSSVERGIWLDVTDDFEVAQRASEADLRPKDFLKLQNIDSTSPLGESLTTVLSQMVRDRVLPPDGYGMWVPFEDGRQVNQGGMGEVRIARHDRSFRRFVAVKSLKLERFNSADRLLFVAKFQRESETLASLEHPGIPAVFERTTLSRPIELPCYSMKLIRGRTLAEASKLEQNAASNNSIERFWRVADAVGYAHQRGVIHRDIKPSNIMVDEHDQIQVIDWGLGVSADESDLRLDDGDAGTLAYMSPEHFTGLQTLTKASDVFSMGSVLCEIITGTPAYTGSSILEIREKAINADLSDAFERLHHKLRRNEVRPEIVDICKKCLAIRPRSRFSDCVQLASAIRSHQQMLSKKLQQTEVALARRNWIVLAGLLFALLISGIAFVGVRNANRNAQIKEGTANQEDRIVEVLSRLEGEAEAISFEQESKNHWRILRAFPDRWKKRLDAMIFNLESINITRASSSYAMSKPIASRIERAKTVVASLKAEHDLFLRVEQIRLSVFITMLGQGETAERSGNYLSPHDEAQEQYSDLFEDHLIFSPEVQDETSLTTALSRSRTPWIWVAVYDDWLLSRRERDETTLKISSVLMKYDSDEWANRVRQYVHNDKKRKRKILKIAKDDRSLSLSIELFRFVVKELKESGQNVDAAELFSKAARRHKNDFEFWLGAGAFAEHVESQMQSFTCAVSLRPKNYVANSVLGVVFLEKGQVALSEGRLQEAAAFMKETEGYFDTSLSNAPASQASALHHNFGVLKEQQVVVERKKAAQPFTWIASKHFEMVDSQQTLSLIDEALGHYEHAVAINPANSMSWNNIGTILFQERKQWKAAAKAYEKACEVSQTNARAWFNLGLVNELNGEYKKAEDCFEKSTRISPKLSQPWGHLGEISERRGHWAQAVEFYKIAIENMSEDAPDGESWRKRMQQCENAFNEKR